MKKSGVITGLAGAAAVAGSSQAYGAVVNVTPPANIVGHAPAATDNGTRVNIDLNGDGTRDLSILYRNLSETGGTLLLAYIYVGAPGGAAPGSSVGTSISGQAYSYNLATGTLVGSTSSFYQKSGYFGHLVTTYAGTTYGFNSTGTRLNIGFEFRSTVSTTAPFDYGYISLEVDPYVSAANPGGIQFFQIAYDNTPGTSIAVGARAVPEPTSLAALAFGAVAAGGVALKKRRQRAAKA